MLDCTTCVNSEICKFRDLAYTSVIQVSKLEDKLPSLTHEEVPLDIVVTCRRYRRENGISKRL